jgi:hypothetical protein
MAGLLAWAEPCSDRGDPQPVGSNVKDLRDVEASVMRSGPIQLWNILARWKVLIGFIAADAVLILGIVWTDRSASREAELKHAPRPRIDEHVWKKRLGKHQINRPSTVRPDSAELPEDATVIGVVVDGRARAYALKSLRNLQQHVVNDVVGGVPITVAHCDVTDCTRVYASRNRSEPLDVTQAGFRDGEMILQIEGVYYEHSSGEPIEPGPESRPLPYEHYPWIRTTWKEWKHQYPETDIYVEQFQ